ncbi:hypothetical protein D3C76_849250 [compost metagenome]
MSFDHHWTARCQRGGSITTQHREGEREVAGREHGHRAQRTLYPHQVRPACWRRTRYRLILDAAVRHASLDFAGEAT